MRVQIDRHDYDADDQNVEMRFALGQADRFKVGITHGADHQKPEQRRQEVDRVGHWRDGYYRAVKLHRPRAL